MLFHASCYVCYKNEVVLPMLRLAVIATLSSLILSGCAENEGPDGYKKIVEEYRRMCSGNNGKLELGPGLTPLTVANFDEIRWFRSKGSLVSHSTYVDWDNVTCKGMDQMGSSKGRACVSKGGVLRLDFYHPPGEYFEPDSTRKPTLKCDTSAASIDVNAKVKPFVDRCSSLGGKLGMKPGISLSESAVAFRKAKGWDHSPYFYSRNPHLSATDFDCTDISNPPPGLGRACVQLGGDLTISAQNLGPEGYKCTYETNGGTVDISDQMRLKINQSQQVEIDRKAGLNTIPVLLECARSVKLPGIWSAGLKADSGACAVPNKDVRMASGCGIFGERAVWLVDKCIDEQGQDVTALVKSVIKPMSDKPLKCLDVGGVPQPNGGCALVSRDRTYEVGNLLTRKFSGEEHEKFVKLCHAKGQVIGNRCFNSFKDDITSVIARQIQPVPPEAATAGRAGRKSRGVQKEETEELGQAETVSRTCFNQPLTSPWYILNC